MAEESFSKLKKKFKIRQSGRQASMSQHQWENSITRQIQLFICDPNSYIIQTLNFEVLSLFPKGRPIPMQMNKKTWGKALLKEKHLAQTCLLGSSLILNSGVTTARCAQARPAISFI